MRFLTMTKEKSEIISWTKSCICFDKKSSVNSNDFNKFFEKLIWQNSMVKIFQFNVHLIYKISFI
jgi:hypothetical protein